MSTHYVKVKNSRHDTVSCLVDSEWLLMQEQMDSGELELAKCRNWIIEPDPFSMNEALPNLRNRDAAGVVGPHSGVPRAERAASAAGRVRYHHQAISASSHLCWARCGVNFWLRGPRLTASCHWNVPECGTSGSSVEYAMCLVVVVVGLGASLSFGSFFPSSVVD